MSIEMKNQNVFDKVAELASTYMPRALSAAAAIAATSISGAQALENSSIGASSFAGPSLMRDLGNSHALAKSISIDSSEQYSFVEPLGAQIKGKDGGPLSGELVTVVTTAPLGYVNAKSSHNLSYTAQRINEIKIEVDGKEIPYIEKPKAGQALPFWTLTKDLSRGSDVIAVRFLPGPATPNLMMTVKGVLINEVPVAENSGYQDQRGTTLSAGAKANYLEMSEYLYTVDSNVLKAQLLKYGLLTEQPPTLKEFLERLSAFSTRLTYAIGKSEQTDINKFFESPESYPGNCHQLNTPLVFAARAEGFYSRKVGGRYLGSNSGHATCQIWDEANGKFLTVDAAGMSVCKGTGAKGLDLIGRGLPRGLLAWEDDASTIIPSSVIEGDGYTKTTSESSSCGGWSVFDGKTYVGSLWPTSLPSGRDYHKITPEDQSFVRDNVVSKATVGSDKTKQDGKGEKEKEIGAQMFGFDFSSLFVPTSGLIRKDL